MSLFTNDQVNIQNTSVTFTQNLVDAGDASIAGAVSAGSVLTPSLTATTVQATTLNVAGYSQLLGGLSLGAPVTLTSNATVSATQNIIVVNNAGGATTLTLPAPASNIGKILLIKTTAAQAVNSASSNIVQLDGASTTNSIVTGTAGKYAWLVSDGTNYVKMAAN